MEGEKGPKVVQRPKLKLGGLLKVATSANIDEYGTGEQTGDLTSMIAVERPVQLEGSVVPLEPPVGPKVPAGSKGPKVPAGPPMGPPMGPKGPKATQLAEGSEVEEGKKYGDTLEKYAEDILSEDT